MAFVNKTRFILTSIGIFVAVLLFSTANIISNSYYFVQFSTAEEMKDNCILVSSFDESSISKIKTLIGYSDIDILKAATPEQILSAEIGDGQHLNVMSNVYGISVMRNGLSVTLENGEMIIAPIDLIKGRMIEERDSTEGNQVIVIDEYTEKLLFPDGNSLGQIIRFNSCASAGQIGVSGDTYDESSFCYKIVGVVKASQASKERYLELKEKVAIEVKDNISYYVDVYVPVSNLEKISNGGSVVACVAQIYENEEEYIYNKELINKKISFNSDYESNYLIATKDSIIGNLSTELQNAKNIIDLGMLILCILSGISIIGITFFSVKERISEIGTRKAFGAGRIDIMFQMMMEMMIISVFASILAVATSLFICGVICDLLLEKLYIYIPLSFGIKEFVLPILIGVLVMCFSSLIPAYYAASIKVTDALRHE